MAKITHTYKGMLQDISKSKYPNNFYYEGKNIRVISTDDNITQAVTNEKGNILSISLPEISIESAPLNAETLNYDLLQNSVVKLKWTGLYKNTNIKYKIYKQDISSDSNNDGIDPVLDFYEIGLLNSVTTEFTDNSYGKEGDIYNYKIATVLNGIEYDSNIINTTIGNTDIKHPSNINLAVINSLDIKITWENDNIYNPFYVIYYRIKGDIDWEILTNNYSNNNTVLNNNNSYTVFHSDVQEGLIYEYQIETSDPRGDNTPSSGYENVSILASLYPKPIDILSVTYIDNKKPLYSTTTSPHISIIFGDLGYTHVSDGKYNFIIQRRHYIDIDDDLTEDELLETKNFKNISYLYQGNSVINNNINTKYFTFADLDIEADTTYIYKIIALKDSSFNNIVYETDEIELDISCNIPPYNLTLSNGMNAPFTGGVFPDQVVTLSFETIHNNFTDFICEKRTVNGIENNETPIFGEWEISTGSKTSSINDGINTTYFVNTGLDEVTSYQFRVKIITDLSESEYVTSGYITTYAT